MVEYYFPETGIYKVEWQAYFEDSGAAGTNSISIYATTDNSNYSTVSTSDFQSLIQLADTHIVMLLHILKV